MAQTGIALARSGSTWSGQELDFDEVEDLDALADLLRDLGGDTAVGFVEEDDEYLGIVRVNDDEPRVFVSDRRVLDSSDLANRLFEGALPVPPRDSEDDEDSSLPDAEPAGDVELVADLGTPGDVLVELLAEGGNLPSDVVAAICERAGCLDVLDAVRGT